MSIVDIAGDIDITHTLGVMGYSLFTTVIAEVASYFLIYRKDEYKNLKQTIENAQKKLDNVKDNGKGSEKKKSQLEAQLKNFNSNMSAFRMKSTFLIGIFMIIMLSALGTEFQGIVVAKLPFVPMSLVSGMTHRGLLGEDLTDCSYLFIYIISSFILRTNIQKIFGFEPPRSAQNPFFNPPKDYK